MTVPSSVPLTHRGRNSEPRGEQPVLQLVDVVKNYGERRAVDHLNLRVKRGEVLAFLGPNGAGKTTTIDMCEGFQHPDSGSITVLGLDPSTEGEAVRAKVGIMLQEGGGYSGIRVRELIELTAKYHVNPLDVDWLMNLVGLTDSAMVTHRRLSGGQKQRLALALALIGRPEIVFLDEPTAGMDTQSRIAVWEIIRSLRRDGVTVVLTTHMMDEAEALADSVVIIDRGRAVASGTVAQLTSGGSDRLRLRTDTHIDREELLKELPKGSTVESSRPLHYEIDCPVTPAIIVEIAQALADQDVQLTHFSISDISLEDVFLEITGRQLKS